MQSHYPNIHTPVCAKTAWCSGASPWPESAWSVGAVVALDPHTSQSVHHQAQRVYRRTWTRRVHSVEIHGHDAVEPVALRNACAADCGGHCGSSSGWLPRALATHAVITGFLHLSDAFHFVKPSHQWRNDNVNRTVQVELCFIGQAVFARNMLEQAANASSRLGNA